MSMNSFHGNNPDLVIPERLSKSGSLPEEFIQSPILGPRSQSSKLDDQGFGIGARSGSRSFITRIRDSNQSQSSSQQFLFKDVRNSSEAENNPIREIILADGTRTSLKNILIKGTVNDLAEYCLRDLISLQTLLTVSKDFKAKLKISSSSVDDVKSKIKRTIDEGFALLCKQIEEIKKKVQSLTESSIDISVKYADEFGQTISSLEEIIKKRACNLENKDYNKLVEDANDTSMLKKMLELHAKIKDEECISQVRTEALLNQIRKKFTESAEALIKDKLNEDEFIRGDKSYRIDTKLKHAFELLSINNHAQVTHDPETDAARLVLNLDKLSEQIKDSKMESLLLNCLRNEDLKTLSVVGIVSEDYLLQKRNVFIDFIEECYGCFHNPILQFSINFTRISLEKVNTLVKNSTRVVGLFKNYQRECYMMIEPQEIGSSLSKEIFKEMVSWNKDLSNFRISILIKRPEDLKLISQLLTQFFVNIESKTKTVSQFFSNSQGFVIELGRTTKDNRPRNPLQISLCCESETNDVDNLMGRVLKMIIKLLSPEFEQHFGNKRYDIKLEEFKKHVVKFNRFHRKFF